LDTNVSAAPLIGDADRLRQAIDHLMSNAVTYTLEGGTVRVHLIDDGSAYEVTVADTGIGIPPAEREQLFQRFFRASNTRSRGIPGTGLGLSISRTIVERHSGAITLRDHTGPGTTFQVRLPAARTDRTASR
jgi:signal transduction histidine kinase